jgi:energy-coupling factor transport system ATP-binding protein
MLAMRPRILILDEPTAGLDPSGASSVLAAISDLKKRTAMSIIVIEHKLDRVVPLADRLVVMEKGRIAFEGPPQEVLERYRDSIKNIGVRLPQRKTFSMDGAAKAPAGEVTVDAKDVRFSFGSREILKGVSFKAHRSEIVGIIGPNGSGKTTFLTHLLGINRPSSGSVSVLGMDAARSKTSMLARRVGYVFQNPDHQIFEKTVQEEASFACRNFGMAGREVFIEASLKRYGLSEYRQKHPHGLSFGEKRRLNLCSILPHGPEVIVLDEPFVGQDYFSVMKMMADMHALKDEGKTLILVSHDVEMVFKHCDRVVCFKDGGIIVDAPPEEARVKLLDNGMADYVPGGMV